MERWHNRGSDVRESGGAYVNCNWERRRTSLPYVGHIKNQCSFRKLSQVNEQPLKPQPALCDCGHFTVSTQVLLLLLLTKCVCCASVWKWKKKKSTEPPWLVCWMRILCCGSKPSWEHQQRIPTWKLINTSPVVVSVHRLGAASTCLTLKSSFKHIKQLIPATQCSEL